MLKILKSMQRNSELGKVNLEQEPSQLKWSFMKRVQIFHLLK